MFTDFEKAFDSVNYNYLKTSLQNQGLGKGIIEVERKWYQNSKARVKLDKKGRSFKISKGV